MSKILLAVISFYQNFLSFDRGVLMIFSPGGSCKFPVSCSEYTKQMIIKYGAFRGLWLGIKRIAICR